jgi:hypothetical protein
MNLEPLLMNGIKTSGNRFDLAIDDRERQAFTLSGLVEQTTTNLTKNKPTLTNPEFRVFSQKNFTTTSG